MTDYGKEHLFDVGFEDMPGLSAKRLNELFGRKRVGTLAGTPIVTDPAIPEGEVRIEQTRRGGPIVQTTPLTVSAKCEHCDQWRELTEDDATACPSCGTPIVETAQDAFILYGDEGLKDFMLRDLREHMHEFLSGKWRAIDPCIEGCQSADCTCRVDRPRE